jgi:hypothetical protein
LCIHGVSLSSIHYSHSCLKYINQRYQYACLKFELTFINFPKCVATSSAAKADIVNSTDHHPYSLKAEYVKSMIPVFFGGQIYWFESQYCHMFCMCICCKFINTKTVQLHIYYLITCFIWYLCYTGNSRNASDADIYRKERFFVWFMNGYCCRAIAKLNDWPP